MKRMFMAVIAMAALPIASFAAPADVDKTDPAFGHSSYGVLNASPLHTFASPINGHASSIYLTVTARVAVALSFDPLAVVRLDAVRVNQDLITKSTLAGLTAGRTSGPPIAGAMLNSPNGAASTTFTVSSGQTKILPVDASTTTGVSTHRAPAG